LWRLQRKNSFASTFKATQADTQPKLLKELAKRKSCLQLLKDLSHLDNFKITLAITRMVGLIAFGRPDKPVISPKVYMSIFKPTYQVFGTLTTPATVTKSMGLPSDALAVKFFEAPLTKFILT
jgi:hypothetical protein